ncbi:Prolyl 3-hydroxylase ogfod1, partial [Quaeritorhiza haematococci]
MTTARPTESAGDHHLQPPSKRLKTDSEHSNTSAPTTTTTSAINYSGLNPLYTSPEFHETFRTAWLAGASHTPQDPHTLIDAVTGKVVDNAETTKDGGKADASAFVKVGGYPFPHAFLPRMFSEEFLREVKRELLEDTFYHKKNDLYEFYQSEDLKLTEKPHLKKLRDTLYAPEFVNAMSAMTGIPLISTRFDIASQRYPQAGHLLCHDDDIADWDDGGAYSEREGPGIAVGEKKGYARRIAFVLYLVDPAWKAEDGGMLELFDSDAQGNPQNVVKSIVPAWNSLAFFEVTSISHHQVKEIFHPSAERVSVTAWFHGPRSSQAESKSSTNTYTPTPKPTGPKHLDPTNPDAELDLSKYLNPLYLQPTSLQRVRDIFLETSSVELRSFLREDIYQNLIQSASTRPWNKMVGPANVRCYALEEVIKGTQDEAGESDELFSMGELMASKSFRSWLENLTQLDLAREPVPGSLQARKFSEGCFTLLHDDAIEPPGLDVLFTLESPQGASSASSTANGKEWDGEWDESWGGTTHYVAGPETLLTIAPHRNTLSL